MISRKTIVLIVLGVILVVGVIMGFVLTKPKPASKPAECYCPPDHECNSAGQCIPKSQCGAKSVPSGQHCSMDKLYCDPLTKLWRCNGNCDSGWEGELCNCQSSTKPVITDVCQGQLPFCQKDGTWKNGAAQNCEDVVVYLKDIAKVQPDPKNPSRPLSDVYCNTGQCNGILTCQQPQGVVQMVCQKQCRESPISGECGKTSNSGSISCSPTESCLCDITTDYNWECKEVYNPGSGAGCPPDPPQKYCKDQAGKDISPLPCTPCYLNGSDGFIRYCPGSGMFPLECISSKFGLYNTEMPTQGSSENSKVTFAQNINLSPPVYPSVDNVLCKNGKYASTKLQDVLDYSYEAVGNPNGNVVYAGEDPSKRSGEIFVPFDPAHHYYYPNAQDPTSVNCLWDDVPTCSGPSHGRFVQWCMESGKKVPCDYNKWSTQTRTQSGYCDCSVGTYNSLTPPASAKHYRGDQCQYDDNTSCSSHGSVKDDGTCECLTDWFGTNCENNVRDFCSGHGSFDFNKSSCVCDADWYGDKCDKNKSARTKCNDHGSYDSSKSMCVCDNDWFGDTCENNVRDFCSGNGTYDKSKSACLCNTDWFGERCDTNVRDLTVYLIQPQVLGSKDYYSNPTFFELGKKGNQTIPGNELAGWNIDDQWLTFNLYNQIAQQFNKFATYFLKYKNLNSIKANIKSSGGNSNGATFNATKQGDSGYTASINYQNGNTPNYNFTFGDISSTLDLNNDKNVYELSLLTPQGYDAFRNDLRRVTSTENNQIFSPSPDHLTSYHIDDQVWKESDDYNTKIGAQVNDFASYHLGHLNKYSVNGKFKTSGGDANGKFFRAERNGNNSGEYRISFYGSRNTSDNILCPSWCGGKINNPFS